MKIAGITNSVAINRRTATASMHAGDIINALQLEILALKAQLVGGACMGQQQQQQLAAPSQLRVEVAG